MQDTGEHQRAVDTLPDEIFDVLIVGAGPAGSTAALHLAGNGHRVLLLDREQFPREKICGDGLISDSIRCLERAGLIDVVRQVGHAVGVITTFSPSRVELNTEGEFITLKRRALDALVHRNDEEAAAVMAEDDRVDGLHESVFRVMLTHMLEGSLTACLQVILISRNIERIADLATNISEDVIFMVRGTTVRHGGAVEVAPEAT